MKASFKACIGSGLGAARTLVPLAVLFCGGCITEIGDETSPPEDLLDTTQQEVWRSTWKPSSASKTIVGMSYSPELRSYAWFTDGFVCRSNKQPIGAIRAHDVCGNAKYQYSAPGNDFKAIAGVGIAKNTSHVYAWYLDSTVTQGTTDNLTYYNGKFVFSRPAKPGGGTFGMNELIEVDNSGNGQWYYYWKHTTNGRIYRTTGDSRHGDSNSPATEVQTGMSDHGIIVGIAFNLWYDCNVIPCTEHSPIQAFYSDGYLNESTTSLNLKQP